MAYQVFAKQDEQMLSMLDDLGMMDDFKEGLEDVEKLLSSHSSQAHTTTTFGHSSGTNPSSHAKFLKEQRKACKVAKKSRKFYVCDRCGKRFRAKKKILSHMLQMYLQQQKPVAMAGYSPWNRGSQTGESNINRSIQNWRIRNEPDGKS